MSCMVPWTVYVQAFRSGCRLGDSKQENAEARTKFTIESSAVFNHLLVYCVGNMHRILYRRLSKSPRGDLATADQAPFLPARSKQWPSLKKLVTSFLRNAVLLLTTVKEDDMRRFLLQRMRHYIVYFKIMPKIGRRFLKALISRWIGSTAVNSDEVGFKCVTLCLLFDSSELALTFIVTSFWIGK